MQKNAFRRGFIPRQEAFCHIRTYFRKSLEYINNWHFIMPL